MPDSPNKNHQKLAQEWFDKAEEDLGTAKLLLKEKTYPASICFHSHQAVEKYLKGFLVYCGKNPCGKPSRWTIKFYLKILWKSNLYLLQNFAIIW